ncbi:hypothetical protein D922_03393 [Enterococcus faecalis 06-MB-DW-09]|nr:hypothetical protein D922_03393 [Enterococcus faecalis 06-MB-DW-09]
MKVIKRIFTFDSRDWKHLRFLFKNMIKQLFKGDYAEAYDAWMWIRIHLTYEGKWKDD